MATHLLGILAVVRQTLGRYIVVLQLLAAMLIGNLLLRLVMLAMFCPRQELRPELLSRALLAGFRLDMLVGLIFIIPQSLHMTLLSNRRVMGRISRWLLEIEWLVAFLFIPLVCIVEYLFFDEFRTRLNYIAFEYLVYPREVCCNIWQSYSIVPLITAVAAIGCCLYVFCRRRFARQLALDVAWPRRWALLATLLAAIGGLWSTTGIGSIEISDDRVVNECASNGLYSFVYYAWTCRFDFEDFYLTIDPRQARDRLCRHIVRSTDRNHGSSAHPLDRTVTLSRPRQDYNVVIVLEESLGADFVGVLGCTEQLTPRFDELSKEGVLLDNFYATGNRTARALEAVLTSLPPLPTESILKRDHSSHVYTLANVLAGRGYERLFITGGRGIFDGVRSFMTSNGFNRFIEQSDFQDAVFVNAWGVSDEDLFRRALAEFDELHAGGRPFLAVLLTVSNHRPYTFPSGRIANSEPTRESAVQYADWALGQFFDQLRSRPYYENTIFIVMGDHGARVSGSQLFPMSSYRVPLLILRPHGEGRGTRCSTLGSSLDVAPTLMGLLGGAYRSVFFGRDVLSLDPDQGYGLMQHNHDVALLDCHNNLTVLMANKGVATYRLDRSTFQLERLEHPDPERAADAVSFYQIANRLYYDECCFPGSTDRQPLRR